MFGDHSFCSCFVGESAGYIWQFKIRILILCDESIEHLVQNISVHFAPFNFMKSWYSPALRLASYPGSSPCRKTGFSTWGGAWVRGYFQTTFCFLQYVLKVMESWTGTWQQGYIFVYHMILGKSLIDIAARLRVCVVCVCVCMCGRGRSSTSLIQALYVNLNEAVALVRITWGSTCIISSVSYVCLAPSALYSIAPGWC